VKYGIGIAILLCGAEFAWGQIQLPEGTKVRCRLEQTITSATAEEGQPVQFSVTEEVRSGDVVVIPQGATATGKIVQAIPKRRMGRTGKLDFSLERVVAADGRSVPLRYALNKKEGGSKGVSTGLLTAGAAVVFWPAAPFFLLMKGKDVTINQGTTFDVFTDQTFTLQPKNNTTMVQPLQPAQPLPAQTMYAAQGMQPVVPPAMVNQGMPRISNAMAVTAPAGPPAQVTVSSQPAGSDVEVDGSFVGQTPATLNLTAGPHTVAVKHGNLTWQRSLDVQPGSSVNLNAVFNAK
jgi:hypothetical protein